VQEKGVLSQGLPHYRVKVVYVVVVSWQNKRSRRNHADVAQQHYHYGQNQPQVEEQKALS
jgi:hypothetical protein